MRERERRCWVCGDWNGGGPLMVLNKKQCQQNHMLLSPIHYFSPNMSYLFSLIKINHCLYISNFINFRCSKNKM